MLEFGIGQSRRYTPDLDRLSQHIVYVLFRRLYLTLMRLQSSAKRDILFLLFYSSLANFNSETEGGVALSRSSLSPQMKVVYSDCLVRI